jgi:hypothetical protein
MSMPLRISDTHRIETPAIYGDAVRVQSRWLGTPANVSRDGSASLTAGFQILIAVLTICIAPASSFASTLLGAIMMFVLATRGQFSSIPAILILHLQYADFGLSGQPAFDTYERLVLRWETSAIRVFGFPITVQYALLLGMATHAVIAFNSSANQVASRYRLPGSLSLWLLAPLWCIAVPSSIIGRTMMNQAWTYPIRTSLAFFGPLSGQVTGSRAAVSASWLPLMICLISIPQAILGVLSILDARMFWVYASLVPACGIALVFKARGWPRLVGAVATIATGVLCLMPVTNVEGAEIGRMSTFTLWGLYIASCLMAMFVFYQRLPGRKFAIAVLASKITCFAILAIPAVVIAMNAALTTGYSFHKLDKLDFMDRFRYKFFDERAMLWKAVYEDLFNAPYFIREAGRSFVYINSDGLGGETTMGAHNIVLEIMRVHGWIAGVAYLIIWIMLIFRCQSLLKSQNLRWDCHALAIHFLAAAFVGGLTGMYMIQEASYGVMCLAGVAIGLATVQGRAAASQPGVDPQERRALVV